MDTSRRDTNIKLGMGMIILSLIALCSITYNLSKKEPKMIRIDCSVAEFNPEIPNEIRKACRDLRNAKYT